jgi:hypothetical protein
MIIYSNSHLYAHNRDRNLNDNPAVSKINVISGRVAYRPARLPVLSADGNEEKIRQNRCLFSGAGRNYGGGN